MPGNTLPSPTTTSLPPGGGFAALGNPNQGGGMTLHDAIQYAKANPTSGFAATLGGFIQKGQADDQAMHEGVDLSFAGRPALKDMYTAHLNKNGITPPPESTIEHLQNGYHDLINKAADNTVQQQQEGGQKIVKSVTDMADQMGKKTDLADKTPQEIAKEVAAAPSPLETASGAIQAVFAPITGIIQAISEKASDSKHVQDFANGVGPLVDLYDQLDKKIQEISAAHPEAAKNIGDAANVLLATMGGETGPAKADIGAAQDTVVQGAKDITKPGEIPPAPPGAPQIAKVPPKSLDATAPDSEKGIGKVQVAKEIGGSMRDTAMQQIFGAPLDTLNFLKENPHFATPEVLKAADIEKISKEVEQKYGEKATTVPSRTQIAEEVQGAVHAQRPDVPTVGEITGDIEQGLQKKLQAINEHSKQYATGTTEDVSMKNPIKVDPLWLKKQIKRSGLDIGKDGRVEFTTSPHTVHPINITDSPRGAQIMQNLWDEYGPKFASGKMSRPTFLKFRQSLAQLANYPGGVDTAIQKASHGIRDAFNTEYRKQWAGLERLDTEHTSMSKDIENSLPGIATIDSTGGLDKIKMNEGAVSNMLNADDATRAQLAARLEGIAPGIVAKIKKLNDFTKEWSGILDENGNLTESAINKIASATAPGRDILLAKLEKATPGIGKKIEQMKGFEKDWQGIFDQHGRLLDDARSKIQSAINEGRQPRLERLKELVPDIETKLDILKAKHDIYNSANKPGHYVKAGLITSGATATAMGGGAVGIPMILAGLASQSPTVMLKILQKLGELSAKKETITPI